MRWIFLTTLMILSVGCGPAGESDLDTGGIALDEPSNDVDDDDDVASCKQQPMRKASADPVEYYKSTVYPVLESDCAACHVAGGDAGYTGFVLSGDAENDYEQVKSLAERLVGGYSYLLMKATGFAGHTGGARFSFDSPESRTLQQFADMLSGETRDDPDDGGEPSGCVDDESTVDRPLGEGIFKDVALLTNIETLNKASMLMRGARASVALQMTVSDGTKESLKKGLRELMQGPEFTEFLMVGANDQLLTDKLLYSNRLISTSWPASYYRFRALDWPGLMPEPERSQVTKYNHALVKEPLALIAFIVTNERDYREVLTANYTVFNSLTYEFFDWNSQGFVRLSDPDTDNELEPPTGPQDWVAGRFAPGVGTGYFIDGQSRHPDALPYPHSGVLTTRPWLARWQNTHTNGQRKRAKMLLKQFLGHDIEQTATRPVSNTSLQDTGNPTFNNPECTGCHKPLDALAGSFQNWGYHGRFRLNADAFSIYQTPYQREDALSEGYKVESRSDCGKPMGEGGYCEGDLWYADRFPTGLVFQGDTEITHMPDDGPGRSGPHDNAALRWVAKQLVRDPRFATGTVEFWWEAVFNRKPLQPPTESDPDFDSQFKAYVAQQQLIAKIAQAFERGGDYGPYNLKDVLIELFSSDWFRATAFADANEMISYAGMGTLLTPEQLDRRLRNTLDIQWPQLLERYPVMYGGIDSENVVERNRKINPLMLNVVKRMASELSCEVVYREFIAERTEGTAASDDPMRLRPASDRRLFGNYRGQGPDDEVAIRRTLVQLHRELWNNEAAFGSPEIDDSYELFEHFWRFETEENPEDMRCMSNPTKTVVPLDQESGSPVYPPVAMRAWRDMLVYLMSDPEFLYE